MYDKYTNDEMYNRPYTMEGEARATESPEGRAWLKNNGILPQGVENMYKAKGGPVGEDELSFLERPLSMPMEGYEWESRPENHVKEPVKKTNYSNPKSKEQGKSSKDWKDDLYLTEQQLQNQTLRKKGTPYNLPKTSDQLQAVGEHFFDPKRVNSVGENLLEIIDPTGISSWDDASTSYNSKNPTSFESIANYGSVIPVLGKIPQAAKSILRGWNAINGAWDINKDNFAEGGYYPTQGPPKALFKGYAEGGYMYPGGGYTLPSGLDPTKPTRQDSLMLFNNALEKIKFYKGNPDYQRLAVDKNLRDPNNTIPHTNFKDPIQRKKLIKEGNSQPNKKVTQKHIDEAIKNALSVKPVTPLEASKLKAQLNKNRFGKIPNTNLTSFGDVLFSGSDDIYNPLAPPIYLHPNITPQGSESYESYRWGDSTDIPYYDPIAVAPFDKLTTEQKEKRVEKYGDVGVPQSYMNTRKKNTTNTLTSTTTLKKAGNSTTIIPNTQPKPIQIDRLEPLRLTNLQTQETPLKLNLSNTEYKEPFKPSRVVLREMGNIRRYNNNEPYKATHEVYVDDGNQWRPVSNAEREKYIQQYPGSDQPLGWTGKKEHATGGYLNQYQQYSTGSFVGEDDKLPKLPSNSYVNKEGVINGPVLTEQGWQVPKTKDNTPIVNLREVEIISTPTGESRFNSTPNPYSPVTGIEFLNSGFNPINWFLPNTEKQVQPIDPKTGMPFPASGKADYDYGTEMALAAPLAQGVKSISKGVNKAYNTVATGNSALPIAWKSPAVGLSQEISDDMFKSLINSGKLSDAERAVVIDYQYNSRPFTGRSGTVNVEKRNQINDIIKKYTINADNTAIATRKFNPKNNSIGATIENGTLNFGDRPTSFSAGVGKSGYGSGSVDRIVIPNRSLKNLNKQFTANSYDPISEEALKGLEIDPQFINHNYNNSAIGTLRDERELVGTGLNLKQVGKVKNDIGGYDWIVQHKKQAEGGYTMKNNQSWRNYLQYAQGGKTNNDKNTLLNSIISNNLGSNVTDDKGGRGYDYWINKLQNEDNLTLEEAQHVFGALENPMANRNPLYNSIPFREEDYDSPPDASQFDLYTGNQDRANIRRYRPDQNLQPKKPFGYGEPEYAQGGYTNPYNQYQDDPHYQYKVGGKTWQGVGSTAWNVLSGTLNTVTGGLTTGIMDMGEEGLQKMANPNFDPNNPEDVKAMRQIETAGGAGEIAGSWLGLTLNPANVGSAVAGTGKGANDIVQASTASDDAKQWSQGISGVMQLGHQMNGMNSASSTGSTPGGSAPGAGAGAGEGVSKFGDILTNFSGSDFGKDAKKAMPYINQAAGMASGNKGSLLEQGVARQDYLNSPEYLALKNQGDITVNNGITFSQGGNITNNSLNLRNTMRYKRFAQGGTFDQYGINMIPDSAGLHHESAYGGVPIGPNALAEGGEIKMDTGDGGQYIVSDQVDGAESQKDFTFSKGGKYKELNRTLADGMKQDLTKYTFGSLATSDRVKGDLRRPNDSYSQSTIEQIKQKWQEKTEYARQRSQQEQAIAQAEEQKRMAEEQYIAAYGGRINPKKYPGLNYAKGGIHIKPENRGKFTASAEAAGHTVQEHASAVLNNPNATPLQKKRANFARNAAKWHHADGGYVHNQMTQPMLATGGPLYGDPASPYTYAMGGMYGDPYARGGQIDYTNDMYSSYAGGGPMVSNVPQAFNGPSAQNRGGMYIYADGGMMPPEQQMMQQQQMQQQAPQEQMQQQSGGQDQMMQMVQQVEQMLQQGAEPQQVMQQLVQSGVPQEQAQQVVQMAMQDLQSQMQQQPQEQPMQQGEQPMQGQEQQMPPQQGMARGGRLPKDILRARAEAHMSPEKAANYVNNYAMGGKMYYKGGLNNNNDREHRRKMRTDPVYREAYNRKMESYNAAMGNKSQDFIDKDAKLQEESRRNFTYLSPYTDQNELRDATDYSKQLTANPVGPIAGPVNMYNQYTNPYSLSDFQEEKLAQNESLMNRSLNVNANQPKAQPETVPTLNRIEQNYFDTSNSYNPNPSLPNNELGSMPSTAPTSPFKPEAMPYDDEIDYTEIPNTTPVKLTGWNMPNSTAKIPGPISPNTIGPNGPITEEQAIAQGWEPEQLTTKTPPPTKNGLSTSDWMDLGTGALSLAGPISQFFQKKPKPFQYKKASATTLDPTTAIVLANQASREAQATSDYNIKQNAPTSGSYLANIRGNALQFGKQRGLGAAGIRSQYDLQNAGILNQFGQYNTDIENRNIDAIQQDQANFQEQRTNALYNAGANVAGMRKDYKANKINEIIAKNIGTNNWQYDEATQTIKYKTPSGQTVSMPVQAVTANNTQTTTTAPAVTQPTQANTQPAASANPPATTVDNFTMPNELQKGNETKAFQDFLDAGDIPWYKGSKLGRGKGYGTFGPNTRAAYAKYKDAYAEKQKETARLMYNIQNPNNPIK